MLNIKEDSPGHRILMKESKIEGNIDFDWKSAVDKEAEENKDGSNEKTQLKNLLGKRGKQRKYFENPQPNWGPKPKATGN